MSIFILFFPGFVPLNICELVRKVKQYDIEKSCFSIKEHIKIIMLYYILYIIHIIYYILYIE